MLVILNSTEQVVRRAIAHKRFLSSQVYIKPDHTDLERKTERILLHQRHKLINEGHDRHLIKLHNTYLDRHLYGRVVNSQFSLSADHPPNEVNGTLPWRTW